MTETPGNEPAAGGAMAADRRAAFEAEISRVQLKAGRAANERRFLAAGLAAMFVGVVVAFIAFLISTAMADTRDVISMSILAVFGLALSVVGAAVFLRYALGRFFRFWLLRLIYEQRPAE
jgi:cation transporter-like permease